MAASEYGMLMGLVQVILIVGDLAVAAAALWVAIHCTVRKIQPAAGWTLFGVAAALLLAGLVSKLFYYVGYEAMWSAFGEAGSFWTGVVLQFVELVLMLGLGAAFLMFRPGAPVAAGEVSHG